MALIAGCGTVKSSEVPFDRRHQLLVTFAPSALNREQVCYECYPTYGTPIDSCAKYLESKRVEINSITILDQQVLKTLETHGAAYMAAYHGFPSCRDLN